MSTAERGALRSMTGFGRGQFEISCRMFSVELRSYNNRFLDIRVRGLGSHCELDARVVSFIKKSVRRGRVDVSVSESEQGRGARSGKRNRLCLDRELAQDLAAGLRDLAATVGCDLNTAARMVPPMRELFEADVLGALDPDSLWEPLEASLVVAVERMTAMRQREGQALYHHLNDNLSQLEQIVGQIQQLAAQEPAVYRKKLMARLAKWQEEGLSTDAERVAQEVALIADRCDIDEETARVKSHAEQMRAIFIDKQPAGRKMEFLLQEFNRELNTMGSKSSTAGVAHLVVEAKASIERMREQALNVE